MVLAVGEGHQGGQSESLRDYDFVDKFYLFWEPVEPIAAGWLSSMAISHGTTTSVERGTNK